MKNKVILNFFAGLLDIFIVFALIFFTDIFLNSGNTFPKIYEILYAHNKTINIIDSLIIIIYFGLIPYFFDYKTVGEKIFKTGPRINIEAIEKKLEVSKKVKLLNNSINLKIEKFVYIFINRFFNFILDVFLINMIIGVSKILKNIITKKKDKKNDK